MIKKILSILFIFGLLTGLSCFASNMVHKTAIVEIYKHKVKLFVADTPELREKGLMNVSSMPDDTGMYFIFDQPMKASFWMKNTKIPLDMVFISNKKVVKIIKNVPVCSKDPCEIYSSSSLVDSVMEFNAGFCDKYNLLIGQRIYPKLQ